MDEERFLDLTQPVEVRKHAVGVCCQSHDAQRPDEEIPSSGRCA